MPNYQRAWIPGGVFFFTVVTHERRPIFSCDDTVARLREAFRKIKAQRPFTVDAMVVLPDHLHCIWQLPEDDSDYSGRWREIKKAASKAIAPASNARKRGQFDPLAPRARLCFFCGALQRHMPRQQRLDLFCCLCVTNVVEHVVDVGGRLQLVGLGRFDE